ncbi:MAG: SDR family NAD(P)-dependent oxidoreductase, partial [Pseudomonadota bacterium]
MSNARFENQRAVVTGGAAGIGAAIAGRIANEGGSVMIWDRDADAIAALCARNDSLHGLTVDLTDADAVDEAAVETEKLLGGIDVLVCSAGITGPNQKTWEYTPGDWRAVFDVNVNGIFYANRACVPVMMAGNYG